MITLSSSPAPVEVGVDLLRTDPAYQRPTNEAFVAKIARSWDDALAGTLLVNRRPDGSHVVLDGGHRLAAGRLAGKDALWCIVTHIPSDEEARKFREINAARRALSPAEVFRARLQYDPVAQDIARITHESGFELQLVPAGIKRPGVTKAFSALETMYRSYDLGRVYRGSVVRSGSIPAGGFQPERLRAALTLCRQTWPEEVAAGTDMALLAADLLLRAEPRLSRARFQAVVGAHNLGTLLLRARARAETVRVRPRTCLAHVFRDLYNKGLRSGRLVATMGRNDGDEEAAGNDDS